MRLTITLILGIVFNTIVLANMPKPQNYWSNTVTINNNWLYLERDTETLPTEGDAIYQKISLPHTWNAKDVLETKDYRRAASWYRKNLEITKAQLKKRLYMRFGAAGQQAKVYLNGKLLTHHFGGYSAFTCELNNLNVGANRIDVWVSNAKSNIIAPISADYNFYGGLYRSVQLITAPKVSISRKHLGGPGFRVWSEHVSSEKSDLKVRVLLDNALSKATKLTLKCELKDLRGHNASFIQKNVEVPATSEKTFNIEMPQVNYPALWTPEHPDLYRLFVRVFDGGKMIDEVSTDYGFKWFKFTADNGFFLNGKPYKLKGVSRHQDYYKKGNALSPQLDYNDIKLMKEAGINWIRLAHYQQNDYMLQLCDEFGILTWEEVPMVNNFKDNKGFKNTVCSMLKDLINQHYNHTSILVWGLGNEVWMGDRGDGKAQVYDMVKTLNNIAHSEDPVRKTIMVSSDNDRSCDLHVNEIPDLFGYNLYRGWYKSDYNSLTKRCLEIKAKNPNKPLIISEFGVGSDMNIHSENPVKQDFSIEYQNDFLESSLEQLAKIKWLCARNYWAFADFGSANRGDSKPHVNQKGILTFDRQKKDAFYLLKSRWSEEPVVYIESPSWKLRGGKVEKNFRVFTNLDKVEFFHNGKSLGVKNKGFEWKVTLVKGKNTVLAKGEKYGKIIKHSYSLIYNPNKTKFKVHAKNHLTGHEAKFAADGNPDTYWAAENTDLKLDLNRICLVNAVKISFLDPNKHKYDVEILGSKDGESWNTLYKGAVNVRSTKETFIYPKQQEQRYIKIKSLNNKDAFLGIEEIEPVITHEKAEKNLYEKVGAGAQ